MKPITKYCRQPATYWEPIGSDGQGYYRFNEPVEIMVRWEDAAGIVVSRSSGEWRPAVKLITSILLKEHGMIRLGGIATLTHTDPLEELKVTDVLTVGVASQIPDIRGKRVLYQAFVGKLE